jgi:CRP-like cAMP-binding protein
MSGPTPTPHDRLIRKLESIADLTTEEAEALRRLPMSIRRAAAGSEVVRAGDRPSESCLVVEGFLCRYKLLPNGARQIMSFHVPGDLPDLQCLHLGLMDHSLGTLTASTLAFIPHPALLELTRRYPGITDALWRDTLIDGAIFREWLTGVGRRTAGQRIAHLMCEVYLKMKAVGLARGNGCAFPISQAELSDALGLSPVHTNRVLQDLRRRGLIVFQSKFLSIPDWDALQAAAMFDPSYLHLDRKDAA